MGDVMPIGPLEWALVVDRHKVLFGSKNRDMQSLRRKFNALAGTTPPTGDAVIPPIVQKAKDVQRAIEIKMDSGGVGIQDLGIDGGGVAYEGDGGVVYDGGGATGFEETVADVDVESEEEDDDAAEEAAGVGANLVNEFGINEEQLHNELRRTPVDANSVRRTPTEHNNQQQGVLLQQAFRPVRPPALNQRLPVPQVPQQQQQPIAPYQALLAAGGVARPPFVASRSAAKLTAEDYYQQMLLSRLERQEMEEQERERRRIEREERLAELELQRLERDRRLEVERRERERDEERKERAEERKAQRDMMNMFMMAFVGRSMSNDDSPAKKKRRT
jgi:hypothetical protein